MRDTLRLTQDTEHEWSLDRVPNILNLVHRQPQRGPLSTLSALLLRLSMLLADVAAQTSPSGLYDFVLAVVLDNGHAVVEALLLATIGTRSGPPLLPRWADASPPVFLVLQRSYTPTKEPLTEKARSPAASVGRDRLTRARCLGDRHPLRRVAPRAAGSGADTGPARRRGACCGHRVRLPHVAALPGSGADGGCSAQRGWAQGAARLRQGGAELHLLRLPGPGGRRGGAGTWPCLSRPGDSPSQRAFRRRVPPPSRSTASARAGRAASTALSARAAAWGFGAGS